MVLVSLSLLVLTLINKGKDKKMKMNKEKIKEQINDHIKLYETYQYIVSIVFPVLEKWDGKVLNKRLHTKVKEALPAGFAISFSDLYSYELSIWGNGIDYNQKYYFNLGSKSDGKEFNFKKFKEDFFDRHFQWEERIKELVKLRIELPTFVKEYEELTDYIFEKKKRFDVLPYFLSKDFSFDFTYIHITKG